jgi:hypothetical protein
LSAPSPRGYRGAAAGHPHAQLQLRWRQMLRSLLDELSMRAFLPAALVAALAAPLTGQQFLSSFFPEDPEVWSEAVVPLDADNDGLLDLLILNAQGWQKPGDFQAPNSDPLPATLMRNTGVGGTGDPVFVDATASFLPAGLVMHAKSAAVADYDGDGLADIAIAVAFNSPQRLLRKSSGAGAWLDESNRLPSGFTMNGFSVVAGDLDDDGDLDLVFADAGPETFGPPGGLARLLLNDGTGFFTDQPGLLGALPKIGAQNVKLVDLDQDLDLDLVLDGKSPVTHAYLNDGGAQFSFDGTIFPTAPGGDTYETEYADLDGDGDFDAFLMNWELPFNNTFLLNDLVPGGTLGFQSQPTYFNGPNSQDENDFAYLDVDDDGDLDLLIGALQFSAGGPAIPEKLLLNTGVVGAGWFSYLEGAFDVAPDATLDLGLGDFDGDGDIDIVSVQGEFLPFRNVYHRNTGPADSHSPEVRQLATAPLTLPLSALDGGWSRRAWIVDALVDDETVYISADLVVETLKGVESSVTSAAMDYVGGALWRGVVDPAPSSFGLVGMDVSYHVVSTDAVGNQGVSAIETTRLCGAEAYGVAAPLASLSLTATAPVIDQLWELNVTGGTSGTAGWLLVGLTRVDLPVLAGTLLVHLPTAAKVVLPLDGNGELSVASVLPNDPGLAGLGAVMQYVSFDGTQPGGVAFSNAVEIAICAD